MFRESLCMALNEGVSAVRCYCRSGNTVDVNVPCTHGEYFNSLYSW